MALDFFTHTYKSNDILGFGSAYFRIENFFIRVSVGKLGMGIPSNSCLIIGVDKDTFLRCFIWKGRMFQTLVVSDFITADKE